MDFSNWVPWIILTLIVFGVYFIFDVVRKTTLSQKSMERLNERFRKTDKDIKDIKEQMPKLPRTKNGPKLKVDKDKFKKLLDMLPEDFPKKK